MKYLIILLLNILVLSCIGDKYVRIGYQISNQTNDTLLVIGKTRNAQNTSLSQDTSYIVLPNSTQIVKSENVICGFGNCKYIFFNDSFLDSIQISRNQNPDQHIKITKDSWKLKKDRAILKIKESQ